MLLPCRYLKEQLVPEQPPWVLPVRSEPRRERRAVLQAFPQMLPELQASQQARVPLPESLLSGPPQREYELPARPTVQQPTEQADQQFSSAATWRVAWPMLSRTK